MFTKIELINKQKQEIDRLNNIIKMANKLLLNILVISDWEHQGRFRPVKKHFYTRCL